MAVKDVFSKLFKEPEYDDGQVSEREEEDFLPGDERFKAVKPKNDKIVNINATTQLQVVIAKAERYEDAVSVADHLNTKHTVVLNMESTNKEVARRVIDFLSGVAYSNNGQIKRIANSTFIITPYNVDLQGDLLDELESSGVYF